MTRESEREREKVVDGRKRRELDAFDARARQREGAQRTEIILITRREQADETGPSSSCARIASSPGKLCVISEIKNRTISTNQIPSSSVVHSLCCRFCVCACVCEFARSQSSSLKKKNHRKKRKQNVKLCARQCVGIETEQSGRETFSFARASVCDTARSRAN